MRASGEHNIILFNKFNKCCNQHNEFNILFITYSQKELLITKSIIFSPTRLKCSALLTLILYSANDVTSKCYYTSVTSFLLNCFITLMNRILCGKKNDRMLIKNSRYHLDYLIFI